MSEKLKPSAEQEALSLLLDEINAGRQPKCADPETAELLAVADLIKTAGIQVRPPQHILDQTVDQALSLIKADKRKSLRGWWYSGTLGTAVAVILVTLLNLLPSWPQVPFAPSPSSVSQQHKVLQPKPSTEQVPLSSHTTTDKPAKQPPNTAPDTKRQLPPPKPNPAVTKQPPAKPSKPIVTELPIIAEKTSQLGQSKAAHSRLKSYLVPEKSSLPVITPLTIPGRVPDLVLTDKKSGVLYQIYKKGTLQEIIITQRFCLKTTDTINDKLKSPERKSSVSDPDAVNIVQMKIFGQEVTIKGRQSRQELLKLAKSLKPSTSQSSSTTNKP